MANSVLTFVAGDKFIFTIRKSLVESPLIRWVNRYEAVASAAGTLDDLITMGQAIVEFERQLSFVSVNFDQWEVATWTPDSQPYNPEAFYTEALSVIGTQTQTTEMLDLIVCGLLRRQALSGRNGLLAMRGCLMESDVEGTSGNWRFSAGGIVRWTTLVASALVFIADYFIAGSLPLEFAMIDALGTRIRGVVTFVIGKISNIKRDHHWFNRPGPVLSAEEKREKRAQVVPQTLEQQKELYRKIRMRK